MRHEIPLTAGIQLYVWTKPTAHLW